jgi:hypothetical protein
MGKYIRLVDYKDADSKRTEFFNSENHYTSNDMEFMRIPSFIYAYWVSSNSISKFEKGMMDDYVTASVGIQTGDNELFLRNWWEINNENICSDAKTVDDSFQEKKWFPYNKGGEYRKWYGNDYMVINWKNDGEDIKKNSEETGHHYQQYGDALKFQPFITWSRVTTGKPAFRYKTNGFLSDMAGFCLYSKQADLLNVIGFCNSVVADYYLDFLAPTLNIMTGPVLSLPYKDDVDVKDEIIELIDISKSEWDSFEISKNFAKHPLI